MIIRIMIKTIDAEEDNKDHNNKTNLEVVVVKDKIKAEAEEAMVNTMMLPNSNQEKPLLNKKMLMIWTQKISPLNSETRMGHLIVEDSEAAKLRADKVLKISTLKCSHTPKDKEVEVKIKMMMTMIKTMNKTSNKEEAVVSSDLLKTSQEVVEFRQEAAVANSQEAVDKAKVRIYLT